jgi:uncharacterized protein (DUF1330 family)
MTLVAIMTVRKKATETFRRFESKAATVMARHGGTIERTVVVQMADRDDLFKEVHIVTFPSADAFLMYRQDGALQEIAHLRNEAVIDTEVLIGEDGPDYRQH